MTKDGVTKDWVSSIAEALLRQGARDFTLDEIAEAIGTRVAGPPEIERLFELLEAAGGTIAAGLETEELAPLLVRVLRAARALRAQGAAASPEAIAAALGVTAREVRVALLYGEVLGR